MMEEDDEIVNENIMKALYCAGATDAFNFLSDYLDAFYEDGMAWKDFREGMEMQWLIRKEELSITTVQ